MICKIQVSISRHPPGPRSVLIYNEDKTFVYQSDADVDLLALMDGKVKAFFHCTVVQGVLDIGEEAPGQDW